MWRLCRSAICSACLAALAVAGLCCAPPDRPAQETPPDIQPPELQPVPPLGESDGAQTVEIRRLQDILVGPQTNLAARHDAATLLLLKRDPLAAEVLSDALASRPPGDVHRAVLTAIAAQADPALALRPALYALGAEVAATDLQDPLVAALAAYRDRALVDELLDRIQRAEQAGEKVVFINALGSTGEKAAVPPLIELLNAAEPVVRVAAGKALARITLTDGLGESHEKWSQWWKEHKGEPRERWLALQLQALRSQILALNSTLQKHEETIAGLSRRLVQAHQESLQALPLPERLALVMRLLDDSLSELRRLAASEARKLLLDNSKEQSPELVAKLLDRAADASPDVRAPVASALAVVKDERASPVLLKRLDAETEGPARVAVIEALGERREARAVPGLTRALDARDEATVIAAASALGQIGERGSPTAEAVAPAVPRLCRRLNGVGLSPGPAVREALVRALARIARFETLDTLIKAMDDTETRVRFYAAQGIGNLDAASPEADAALLRHLADADKGVRTAVANTLGKLAAEPAARLVAARLLDANGEKEAEVRAALWRALTAIQKREGQAVTVEEMADSFSAHNDPLSPPGALKLYEIALEKAPADQTPAQGLSLRLKLADLYVRLAQPNKAADLLRDLLARMTDGPERDRVERKLGLALMQVPPYVPGAEQLARLALRAQPADRDRIVQDVFDRARQLKDEGKIAEAYGALTVARETLAGRWSAVAGAGNMDAMRLELAGLLLDQALAGLRADDEAARKRADEEVTRIVRSMPGLLLDRLRKALEAGNNVQAADLEKFLPSVVNDVAPYAAAQTTEEKLKLIADWRTALGEAN